MVIGKEESVRNLSDLSNLADILLKKIDTLRIIEPLDSIEDYYYNILRRFKITTRDIALIINKNSWESLDSAYILSRVILDDFLRLLKIHTTENKEEEISALQGTAMENIFKTAKNNYEINTEYFDGEHEDLATKQMHDQALEAVKANPKYSNLLSPKQNQVFKSVRQIAQIFESIDDNAILKENEHAYSIYKDLSRHIHYSNLYYPYDNFTEQQQREVIIFGELQKYLVNMLKILNTYFITKYTFES